MPLGPSDFALRTAQARPAFTLIELLVVIAIIALLIAILLPALGQSQHRASMGITFATWATNSTGHNRVLSTRLGPKKQEACVHPRAGSVVDDARTGQAAELSIPKPAGPTLRIDVNRRMPTEHLKND